MNVQIPQDILDQMSSIIAKMREFIDKYHNNTSVDDAALQRKTVISCKSLSKEVKRLAYLYNYTEVSELGSNVIDVDTCSLAIEDLQAKFEVLEYINGLRGENFLTFDNEWKNRIRSYVGTIKSILDKASIENERLKNFYIFKIKCIFSRVRQNKNFNTIFPRCFFGNVYGCWTEC